MNARSEARTPELLGDDPPIRVLVVDDHDLFRTGLASFLQTQPDIELVAQASGGRRGVRLAHELRPDVVLMDLRMPDMGGIAATLAILDGRPSTRVVALTVASEDAEVTAAIKAGACGFLGKDTPMRDVAAAVRAAAYGVAWLSPSAADAVLGRVRRAEAERQAISDPSVRLSPRELEVLHLIAQGMENAAIAKTLNISPLTVKKHVSSILTKLGLPNRIHAAIYAVRSGLG
jgi:DNA-binding NarL/FixJ family response regulator